MRDAGTRDERADDGAAVRAVHTRAFGGPLEARLVDALRAAGAGVISRVAVVSREVVGHVLASPVRIEGSRPAAAVLGLAPLGVLPEHQRRGAGTALMRAALAAARARGAGALVLLGEPAFYGRFGFTPARSFDLRCRWPGTEDAFMALELAPGALAGSSGLVSYHEAFDALEQGTAGA